MRMDAELSFWRSQSGYEVDFVIGGHTAIEVKAAKRISRTDLRGLLALAEEVKLKRKIIVAGETHERRTDEGVIVLPVTVFFKKLWEGSLWE